jgi:hypothetical protein
MARPKKAESSDMLRVVDSFYETHGNASKLKYKALETYAISLGIDAKEYDFRRDDAVKRRIDELTQLRDTLWLSLAYKTLDADALIYANPTRASLKAALTELDRGWREVFERAVKISSENTALLSKNHSVARDADVLRTDIDSLKDTIAELKKQSADLLTENRYLKSALESWLYPDIANEILRREGVLDDTKSNIIDSALEELAGLSEPMDLDQIVAMDSERMTRAQVLIDRMESQVMEGKCHA